MTDDLRQRLDALPTAELVAILQKRDQGEWRPEVFPIVEAMLVERNVDPASIEREPLPESDFSSLETVATFSTAIDANLARMALTQAGIESTLTGEHLAGVHAPLGMAIGVGLLVASEDATAAREVLEGVRLGKAEVAEEPEPNKGSEPPVPPKTSG